ncbi:MAG: aminotransferase class V-fold PLP-dependent enzyme [Cyclobacteriaceae bacterium]|nr:aminotransferase class V-fold PLP-dependent enzyme [Cyclobacteriaceae bacterium]MDW8330904.1 aminotransferase class V-fold PLP-dependent enzyme [Cyclobacteriaceae bacterium]
MKHLVSFAPGPSQLYFTVPDHLRQALREGIPSMSHRSAAFEKIFAGASENLRELLNLPDNFSIFFCSSATEIWERIIQNLTAEHSVHLSTGAFGKRFYETALQLKRHAVLYEKAYGDGFTQAPDVPPTELIAITHNETSTGVTTPHEIIKALRLQHPQSIIAVDAVSSLPYPQFDFTTIDTLFFSVQKGFGLPAGLGVWIVNERCIEKEEQLRSTGQSTGTYHSLTSLLQHARKHQTPETPNVLGIYLLEKVTADMLRRGITAIRKETEYKAAVLYHALEQHQSIRPFVKTPALRSPTVIVAETSNLTDKLYTKLSEKGLLPGEGYGPLKASTLRFANFPAHSKEQFEKLADLISNG